MENNRAKVIFTIDLQLFIIFLMLKLDGIINWQWIWVFSPFWIIWMIEWGMALFVAITCIEPKRKHKYYVPSGPRLVWDAKTKTMYGPFDMEDNAND